MKPFIVNIADIRRSGRDRRERRDGVITAAVTGSAVPEGATVVADLLLQAAGRAVEATGEVRAPWVGECRRCLGPAVGELIAAVDHELFEPDPDDLSYPLKNDEIDLEPLVRDAVLLELPLAPLCREDCQGLCPICGADRNEVTCECQPAPDPRWAALDALRENN